jgi:hypothetical protein
VALKQFNDFVDDLHQKGPSIHSSSFAEFWLIPRLLMVYAFTGGASGTLAICRN